MITKCRLRASFPCRSRPREPGQQAICSLPKEGAGYTIYLLHHFLVVLFATLVAAWLPKDAALLKYLVVVSVVLCLTIAAHRMLIARTPLLRFMFNGRVSEGSARLRTALAKSAT